jgi:hypothetical protein
MKKKPTYALLYLSAPTVAVVVAVLVLMNWRVPTSVQVDLTVNRAVFIVDGIDSTPILNAVGFQSLTVGRFARLTFSPERLEIADPGQYKPMEDRYLESAWEPLRVTLPVTITGEDETLQPAVTVEGSRVGLKKAGTLDRIWARPGAEVTVEVTGATSQALTVKVDRRESFATLSLREPFQLITEYGRLSGITGSPHRADSLTYRAQLPPQSPIMEITGRPHSLVLIMVIPPEETSKLFFQGGIPVTALDFTRQNSRGDRETTLVKDGEITYPDYPKIAKVSLKPSEFVGLDHLQKFHITEVALDRAHQGIRFRLNGIAGHIRGGLVAFSKDHRLSRFDILWDNPRWMALFSIVLWVFPTTVGGYRLYKEVRGGRS